MTLIGIFFAIDLLVYFVLYEEENSHRPNLVWFKPGVSTNLGYTDSSLMNLYINILY